jgi:hypothetical protein
MVPPLVVAAVVGCVWYALDSRPSPTVAVVTSSNTTSAQVSSPIHTDTQLVSASPLVRKLGSQLEFTVNSIPYKNVQKVEFYVEKQFVGAAYSKPYSVAMSENNLSAGNHTVTARIYTSSTTTDSQPVIFTSKPTSPPKPAVNTTTDTAGGTVATTPAPITSPSPTTTPSSQATVMVPTDVSATTSSDGTSATLNWNQPDKAVTSYQVWRDGQQVAIPNGSGYTDTGLNPGQTYDYQIVAVAASGTTSDPSATMAVTMPKPQVTPLAKNISPQDPASMTQPLTT